MTPPEPKPSAQVFVRIRPMPGTIEALHRLNIAWRNLARTMREADAALEAARPFLELPEQEADGE